MQGPHCCFELWKKRLLVGKLPKPTEIGNFFTSVVSRNSHPSSHQDRT